MKTVTAFVIAAVMSGCVGGTAPAGDFREVVDFGSNPGQLRMLTYVPDDLGPRHPLVVVLHGCLQRASTYASEAGWTAAADKRGFALLLPRGVLGTLKIPPRQSKTAALQTEHFPAVTDQRRVLFYWPFMRGDSTRAVRRGRLPSTGKSRIHGGLTIGLTGIAGQRDQQRIRQFASLTNCPRQLVTVDFWQANVNDGNVGTKRAEQLESSLTISGVFNNETFPTVTNEDWFGWSVAVDGNRILIGAYHDETNGENVGQAHLFTPGCDFNSDVACDIDDLNTMLAEGPIALGVAVTPGVNDQFDLTGDGVIDNSDVDQWLADAATINGYGSPYKRGDANLDGLVDIRDFNDWNANKFTATLFWDRGKFNGDGNTDVSDFNTWNANKFTASDGFSQIPEPGTAMMSAVAQVLLGAAGRVR